MNFSSSFVLSLGLPLKLYKHFWEDKMSLENPKILWKTTKQPGRTKTVSEATKKFSKQQGKSKKDKNSLEETKNFVRNTKKSLEKPKILWKTTKQPGRAKTVSEMTKKFLK